MSEWYGDCYYDTWDQEWWCLYDYDMSGWYGDCYYDEWYHDWWCLYDAERADYLVIYYYYDNAMGGAKGVRGNAAGFYGPGDCLYDEFGWYQNENFEYWLCMGDDFICWGAVPDIGRYENYYY